MNNFKKIGEIENSLAQLIDILAIVKNNHSVLSPMEKDLILQKLRDIYLVVLHEDNIQNTRTNGTPDEIPLPEKKEAEIKPIAEERIEEERYEKVQIETREEEPQPEEVIQAEGQRMEEIRTEMFEEANEEIEELHEEGWKEERDEEAFQPEMAGEEEPLTEKTEEIVQAEEQRIEEIRMEMLEETNEEIAEEKELFQPEIFVDQTQREQSERLWDEEVRAGAERVRAEENEKEEPFYEKAAEIILEEKEVLMSENIENKKDISDLFDNIPTPEQNKTEEKQEVLENDLFQFLPSEFNLGHKKEPEITTENVTIEKEEVVEKHEVIAQPENVREIKNETIHEEPRQEIKPEKRSLNDLLNEGKEDRSVGSKFQDVKVTDLAKSISLNDKFLYIKELFQNRGEEFSQAIQILNNCNTIEEAFNEMEVMKKHYFWDSTSPAYLSLCDLLRRKFL